MGRALLISLFVVGVLGCGSGKDQPVIPTELKQPPGMDSGPGGKAKPTKGQKAPDAGGQSSADG